MAGRLLYKRLCPPVPDPLPLPKVSEPVPVCLTEEMARQLIAAADKPWYRVLVVLLLSTGIRRAEAVSITLDDIDLENRQLLVRGKGDKQRVVPLTEQAVEAIQDYLPHRTNGLCRANMRPLRLGTEGAVRAQPGRCHRALTRTRGLTPARRSFVSSAGSCWRNG